MIQHKYIVLLGNIFFQSHQFDGTPVVFLPFCLKFKSILRKLLLCSARRFLCEKKKCSVFPEN